MEKVRRQHYVPRMYLKRFEIKIMSILLCLSLTMVLLWTIERLKILQ